METPEQVENALRERLVPRGFSDRGMAAMEEALDEMAAEDPVRRFSAFRIGVAAAAVAMVSALSIYSGWQSATPDVRPMSAGLTEVELLTESQGVVSAEPDERIMSDPDGNLLQAWHVQVVNEEVFRDAETGQKVRVVHPRDEVVLMPVSTF